MTSIFSVLKSDKLAEGEELFIVNVITHELNYLLNTEFIILESLMHALELFITYSRCNCTTFLIEMVSLVSDVF